MAHVTTENPDLSLDEPMLVDGLPGEGLIGKLIADPLSEFDMEYYAGVYCEGVPPVAAYRPGDSEARPGIQLYADADHDLLVLVSDISVPTSGAPAFAGCLTDWLRNDDVTPVYVSGLSVEGMSDEERSPTVYGISTGDGDQLLSDGNVEPSEDAGMVTGPTGALINQASDEDVDGVGLLVETDGSLPDFDAAQDLLDRGIEPPS